MTTPAPSSPPPDDPQGSTGSTPPGEASAASHRAGDGGGSHTGALGTDDAQTSTSVSRRDGASAVGEVGTRDADPAHSAQSGPDATTRAVPTTGMSAPGVAAGGSAAGAPMPGEASADPAGETSAPPKKPRGRGNWRSLLLSTAAVLAVLFVVYAVVPRPDSVTQPPVDVAPVAQEMQRSGTTVWLPQLGEPGKPWKATSVRYADQPPSFYAGYTRTDDDTTFVAVQEIPTKTPAAQADSWRVEALSNGREDGTSSVAGTTWKRYTTGGDPTRRGLLGTRGDMTVVVSGLADYATLEAVAASLQPYGK